MPVPSAALVELEVRYMKIIVLLISALVLAASHAFGLSPYAGEELRLIKSLSPEEIESLRAGEGMGFAKLAELNGFPGPKHVLELAGRLALSPTQLAKTEALFEEMQTMAVALGEELLEAEMGLDHDFSKGAITPGSLESALTEIARIRAQLRYVHLAAHLRQKRLLSTDQIAKYAEFRGYRLAEHDHEGHPKSQN